MKASLTAAAGALWFALTCLAPPPLAAEATGEYEVKAAFVYNFTKFVEWPESAFPGPDAPLSICVIGEDPFGGALDSLRAKTVKNRKVAVKRAGTAEEARGCHVLFIGPMQEDRADRILSSLKGAPVLLTGDVDRFVRRGGMIGFFMERHKVVFEINENAAKNAGLRISSQLLKLARTVY